MQPPVVWMPQALPYYGGQQSYPVEWGVSRGAGVQVIGEDVMEMEELIRWI